MPTSRSSVREVVMASIQDETEKGLHGQPFFFRGK
jgi:hypothetical protein